jgi:hypothetical protein
MNTVVSIIKDIVNIIFFIVTAIIGILTYSKAKKTILQPIKTEVFKIQLKVFTEIMELFNGKSELELREFFCIEKTLMVNTIKLLDNYANLFFDYKPDVEKRPYNIKDCQTSIIANDYIEKYCELDDDPIAEDNKKEINNKPDAMTRAFIWSNQKVGILSIPNEFNNANKKIEAIMKSPVLPKDCVELLKEILEAVMKNIYLIMDILDDVRNEIPDKYPNLDLLQRSRLSWIHNRYNDKIESLSPLTNKLTDYLRNYLLVDDLKK